MGLITKKIIMQFVLHFIVDDDEKEISSPLKIAMNARARVICYSGGEYMKLFG